MKSYLVLASLSSASSFVTNTPPSLVSTMLHASGKSDAEAHMEVMPKIWDELKKTEKNIVIQQQVGEIDETDASKALAEKLLETALDYVRTKERIEEDLASTAHKTFEHAKKEERVLKEYIVEEEDIDIFSVDSYVDERLHNAQEKEKEAHVEEAEHLNKWAELRMEEEAIKQTLKDLKDLEP
mmetsp:Transcript_5470/g.11888  ORF Transcript_5470/g.11888 Transcript_5470/m.11888 type:complete len:183 (+) Transcript_5470:48-596(+)|eukprot:CAMPEP_0183702790 /NCGR_PEP_ID=MMETSP0737-20130205/785_1 /TAXON_ID=385413 /ORGANISM="Thalassiosira miniscula, Strain CCMP1093" /LENGTH=182 /DNA_ID=CAMNT_0025929465 /DNA_START=48 /DNA_END=596 /DNA_ORIENTATION=+